VTMRCCRRPGYRSYKAYLKNDGRDPVILSDEQYEQLLKACKNRDMLELYVLALGETGGRCESEILWIQWDDIDLDGGFLKIVTGRNGHRTKGGKSRWVPISPRLRVALREHSLRYRAAKYDGQPSPWVFHHTKTRRHHKAGKRIRSLTVRSKLPQNGLSSLPSPCSTTSGIAASQHGWRTRSRLCW